MIKTVMFYLLLLNINSFFFKDTRSYGYRNNTELIITFIMQRLHEYINIKLLFVTCIPQYDIA